MKSLLILASGLLLTIQSVSASVPDLENPAVAYVQQQNLVKVFYKAPVQQNVSVSIYDNQNNRIFEETLRKVNGFSRPYNFSSLPDGAYTIKVSIGDREISSHKQIVNTADSFEKKSVLPRTIAHVTTMSNTKGKYVLSVPSRGKDRLAIRIYNEGSGLVYRSEMSVADETAIVLNLSGLKGAYSLDVASKDNITNTFQLLNQ